MLFDLHNRTAMKIIRTFPVPVCGIALALSAVGNLLQDYHEILKTVPGITGAAILLMFVVRCVSNRQLLREDLHAPITASVFGTFPMALMLQPGYIQPLSASLGLMIWYLGVLLHFVLILWFTRQFLLRFQLSQLFVSWYVVYIGIVLASITSPEFGTSTVGVAAFWFGLISFIIGFAPVIIRYIKLDTPPPAKPIICIYAAPFSILLYGALQIELPLSSHVILTVWIVATAFYLFAFGNMFHLITKKFYPSWAAFTFPFVISAAVTKHVASLNIFTGSLQRLLALSATAEILIACTLIVYVTTRLFVFILHQNAA